MEDLIDSLDLFYFKYDKKTNTLSHDPKYSDKTIETEFFKITYYLCEHNIDYKVLKDKSIRFGFSELPLKEKLKIYVKNLKYKK
jgi:hypothetical protein